VFHEQISPRDTVSIYFFDLFPHSHPIPESNIYVLNCAFNKVSIVAER